MLLDDSLAVRVAQRGEFLRRESGKGGGVRGDVGM